ncbi:27712_t:CDS:2, partial [Racocetra persica]
MVDYGEYHTTRGDSIGARYSHTAVLSAIVPSQPPPPGAPFTLNTNIYLFNTQNYTWVNTFDISIINGTSPPKPDNNKSSNSDNSLSLGAKIGIGVGAVAGLVIIGFAGFFIYNKLCKRDSHDSIATP